MLKFQNYRDNLDVTLTIDGNDWGVIEARVELSKATRPDFVDMIITPSPKTASNLPEDPTVPKAEGGLLGADFELSVDNELTSIRDVGNEETLLFKGKLGNLSTAAEGAFEGLAYDPSQEAFDKDDKGSFYNTVIDVSEPSESQEVEERAESSGPQQCRFDEEARTQALGFNIEASALVDEIMEQVGIVEDEYEKHFTSAEIEQTGVTVGRNIPLHFSEKRQPVSAVLTDIKNKTNSEYWFDREGTFHIGSPTEAVDGHKLTFITDTSAGKTTPNYRSVKVIGDGIVSKEGWSRSTVRNHSPINLAGDITDESTDGDDNLAEPTFVYRNMSITTREQAEAVREDIIEDLKSQKSDGTITVVGMPEIRPFHTVEMPDTNRQPMGGSRYGVNKVTHKLNSSDGFVTDIKVEGIRSEHETVYSGELQQTATKIQEAIPYLTGDKPINEGR